MKGDSFHSFQTEQTTRLCHAMAGTSHAVEFHKNALR